VIRCLSKIIPILIFSSIFITDILPIYAQQMEPAEIIGIIDAPNNKIPSIKTANWTTINITVEDVQGFNWTQLSKVFAIRAKYIWPIIHPKWRPYLGYTSLRFQPEIIQGDPRGWFMEITPNTITGADQGKTYHLQLRVKTDNITVDYAVVIGVKVTRVDVFGNDFGQSYIYIPVKASSLNNVKMIPQGITNQNIAPHSYGYFDITIQNFGYYRDMFRLQFVAEDGLIAAATQQLFVLSPSDSQNVRINFLTPEQFFDIGTPNKIDVYVTSQSDPNPKLIGTLVVITQGFYISPLIGIILAPIIIILLLIFFFFFIIKTRRDRERYGKPEKPWKLPEEREHLRELKQTDNKAYEQERLMMEDEYKSAMLYYKDYRQSLKAKPKEEVPEKKEQPKKPLPTLFKKSEKPPKVEEKKVEAIVPTEDKNKEKALAKIQREQAKQLKRKKE